MRADIGLANDDGGIETGTGFGWVVVVIVVSDFRLSPEQLLDLDGFDRGDAGCEVIVSLAGAVFVSGIDELVVVTESDEAVEVRGGFSARLNFTNALAD